MNFHTGVGKKMSASERALRAPNKDAAIMKCFFVPNVFKYFISEMVAFHGFTLYLFLHLRVLFTKVIICLMMTIITELRGRELSGII